MSEAQKKGFIAPKLNLSACNKPMVFWRSRIPIVKNQVTYKGQLCEVLEGSCLIAENLNVKITVKKDEFTTVDGTEIVYRISVPSTVVNSSFLTVIFTFKFSAIKQEPSKTSQS